jgi:hypothetical protein
MITGPAAVEDMHAVGPAQRPIPHRIHIGRLGIGRRRRLVFRHCHGFEIQRAESFECAGVFRRADDTALFIDPDRLGHIDHVVQFGHAVVPVDQRRVSWRCLFNPGTGGIFPAVHGHGDNNEIVLFHFVVKFLPHGQISTTASPTGPGGQQDLFAFIIGQAVGLAI